MNRNTILVAAFLSHAVFAAQLSPTTVAGQWRGVASTEDETTRLVLAIENRDGKWSGSMNLPDVGVSGWPATTVTLDQSNLTLAFPSDSGEQLMQLKVQGETLVGQWRESQNKGDAIIRLERSQQTSNVIEQRLSIDGPAGKIGASLILPSCPNKCPAIVFLHGSGPQPRDANRFAALTFAEHGIASLIFDKRGVGESTGTLNRVTFDDLAADGVAAANFLAALPSISSIGFSGHSQGGWIAPLAASQWNKTAFVITSAGPAVSPVREAEWDVVYALRRAGLGNETRSAEDVARQVLKLFHDGVRSEQWQPFENAMERAKKQSWFTQTPLIDYADHSDENFLANYKAIMDHDPMPSLKALKVPMLAILSPDDESIDSLETIAILNGLIKNGKPIQLKLLPGYNHSMRRLSAEGKPLRWPTYPIDYFLVQATFVQGVVAKGE